MKAQILKLAGVKSEAEFYKKFPTEESFMAKHGKALKKLQAGDGITPIGVKSLTTFAPQQSETTKLLNNIPKVPEPMSFMPYVQAAGDIAQGISMIKGQKKLLKKAKSDHLVSALQLQAARSRDVDRNNLNNQLMIRPEDREDTGEEFFPVRGVGTNVLQAKKGTKVKGHPGEIQNTYAPNTLYDDLGIIPIAQNGFMDTIGSNAGMDFLNKAGLMIANGGEGPDAGSMIGGGAGSAIGTLLGGPAGGAIGKFAGTILGGVIDRSDVKRKKYNIATTQNQQATQIAGMNMHNEFMEHGGNLTNPQVITKFGNIDVTDLHEIAHKGMNTLRIGGHISENKYALGGDLKVYRGEAEPISQNPHLPDGGETVMFRGPSHAEGGMPIKYGQEGVEVEGGEPAVKLSDGGSQGDESLVVFGNLPISNTILPLLGDPDAKGKKFKNYIKDLSKKEDNMNKLTSKSINKLQDLEVTNKFDTLTANALRLNLEGSDSQLQIIADKKQRAADLQDALHHSANQHGLDVEYLAKGVAKKATPSKTAQNGYSILGKNPGSIDYNPIAPDYNKDYWNSEENYKKNWIPKVESAFSDPTQAQALVSRIENYSGQDNADVRAAIAKGKTLQDKINIAKRLGTDMKIGPYHQLLKDLIGGSDEAPVITKPDMPLITLPEETNTSEILSLQYEPVTKEKQKSKYPWMEAINATVPFLRPSNREDLDPRQLAAEMFALSSNQLEPVNAHLYNPQLDVPYDISYQDILNKNQRDFRAMQRMIPNNPAMAGNLAAQKYNANQQVLGEQFRANQNMKNEVYNRNRAVLNDAMFKNLGILDTQYQRQSAAKSATKATTIEALKSISDKFLKNQLENRTLGVMENMYNYRYDNQGRAINMNPLATWNTNGNFAMDESAPLAQDKQYLLARDNQGNLVKEDIKTKPKSKLRNGFIVSSLKRI